MGEKFKKHASTPTSHTFKDTIDPSSLLVIAWALQAGANVPPSETNYMVHQHR
jgi:hypothetical protein